ncbi:MAG: carboxypeptidase-like regulatory domain-containing protein, partial [Flavobacteriaceae bacterium]
MKTTSYLLFLISCIGLAQTGTIKGVVIDKQSESPLEGATIELLNMDVTTGVVTDTHGRFTLNSVPLGRQTIRISFIGYESTTVPNLEVSSGKDKFVSVQLLESFNQLNEIILSNSSNKDKAQNKMAAVSARQFGLEEVTRFSGGRSDVGRLAANFAGVSAPDDS